MNKPVCDNCSLAYEIIETGSYMIEMFSSPPRPYKIWSCDTWQCRRCKNIVTKGYGQNPIAHHYDESFEDVLDGVMDSKQSKTFCYETLSDSKQYSPIP